MDIECGFIQSCLNWNMYCCFSFVAVSHSLNAIYRKSICFPFPWTSHLVRMFVYLFCFFLIFFCVCILYYCSKFLHFLFRKFYVDFPILLIESEMTHKKLCPILFIPPQKRRTTKKIWNLYWVWTKMHCIY